MRPLCNPAVIRLSWIFLNFSLSDSILCTSWPSQAFSRSVAALSWASFSAITSLLGWEGESLYRRPRFKEWINGSSRLPHVRVRILMRGWSSVLVTMPSLKSSSPCNLIATMSLDSGSSTNLSCEVLELDNTLYRQLALEYKKLSNCCCNNFCESDLYLE